MHDPFLIEFNIVNRFSSFSNLLFRKPNVNPLQGLLVELVYNSQ
jgi:hypothetical protein